MEIVVAVGAGLFWTLVLWILLEWLVNKRKK